MNWNEFLAKFLLDRYQQWVLVERPNEQRVMDWVSDARFMWGIYLREANRGSLV